MGLARDARNLKKLKTILRDEFRLRQKLEYIDWQYDVLEPQVMEFEGKAQLPELPSETIIKVEYVDDLKREDPKPRAARRNK